MTQRLKTGTARGATLNLFVLLNLTNLAKLENALFVLKRVRPGSISIMKSLRKWKNQKLNDY